jgi:hypothetical protein
MGRGKRAVAAVLVAEAALAAVVVAAVVVVVIQKIHVNVFIKKEHGIRIGPKQLKIKSSNHHQLSHPNQF